MDQGIMKGNSSNCLVLGAGTFMPHMVVSGDLLNPVVTGTMVEVIKMFSERLGFCYKFRFLTDGAGLKLPNGSWTGVMKLLISKEVDFTALGVFANIDRAEDADISEFLYFDEWAASFKRPVLQSDIGGFLKPLTYEVWVMIFIAMLAVIAVTLLLGISNTQRFEKGRGPTVDDKSYEAYSTDTNLHAVTLRTVAVLVSQSLPRNPEWTVMRTVGGVWLVMTFILGTVYRGNLKAMLILPKVTVPFDNLEELVHSKLDVSVPMGCLIDSIAKRSPKDSIFGRLKEQFVNDDIPFDFDWHVRGLRSGDWVLAAPISALSQSIHTTFTMTGKCPTYVMQETYFKNYMLCILLQKNSPWKAKLDPMIVRLRESGILDHIYKKGITNATECMKPIQSQRPSRLRPLGLGDFSGAFVVYLVGAALSAAAFLTEVLMNRG